MLVQAGVVDFSRAIPTQGRPPPASRSRSGAAQENRPFAFAAEPGGHASPTTFAWNAKRRA